MTLFCYANPALPALLDAWAEGDAPVAVHRPRRRGAVGTRPLDRRRDAASRRAVRARPADAGRRARSWTRTRSTAGCGSPTSTSSAARTRSSARSGRGQPLRLAALPAGGRRAPREDGRVPDAPRGGACPRAAASASGRSGTRGTPATRTPWPTPGPDTGRCCRRSPCSRGPGRARWRARRISRRVWSGSAKIVYNYGFPGFATHGVVGPGSVPIWRGSDTGTRIAKCAPGRCRPR